MWISHGCGGWPIHCSLDCNTACSLRSTNCKNGIIISHGLLLHSFLYALHSDELLPTKATCSMYFSWEMFTAWHSQAFFPPLDVPPPKHLWGNFLHLPVSPPLLSQSQPRSLCLAPKDTMCWGNFVTMLLFHPNVFCWIPLLIGDMASVTNVTRCQMGNPVWEATKDPGANRSPSVVCKNTIVETFFILVL